MADDFRTAVDWEDVRFFVALARHGSLSGAARALGVNHSTVARRVESLEAALGARLAVRRPDGYRLTAAGQRALQAAAGMSEAARLLASEAQSARVGGLVRITATESLCSAFLVDRLGAFRQLHPDIDIEIIADRQTLSLSRHAADLALRRARPTDGDLIARQVVRLGFGYYGNADWRQRLKAGEAPELVGFDEAGSHLLEAEWMSRRFAGRRIAFRAASQILQAHAATAGYGIAMLPHYVGRAFDELAPVLEEVPVPDRGLWLIRRREADMPEAVRLAHNFLVALFAEEGVLFEDARPSASGAQRP